MEDLQKQFISFCQSNLAKEGKEICEEILVMIGGKDELMMEKAKAFCEFFLSYKLDGVNAEELLKRCKKYKEDLNNFKYYQHIFGKNRIKENLLDVGGMRLKNL